MSALIGYGNLIDSATITTTGTWSGTYPATNVKNRLLGVFARTTLATSELRIDLGSAKTIDVIGMAGIVAPPGSRILIMYSTNNWSTSSVLPNANNVYLDEFGSFTSSCFVPAGGITARYWAIQAWNFSGQFDIGRVFIGPALKPTYGLSFGAELGLEDRTTREESAGGVRYHRTRPMRKTIKASFDYLVDYEAHTWRWIMRTYGRQSEYVFIWDDADTGDMREDRNMLCNIDELSAVEFPQATIHKVGIQMSEIIA